MIAVDLAVTDEQHHAREVDERDAADDLEIVHADRASKSRAGRHRARARADPCGTPRASHLAMDNNKSSVKDSIATLKDDASGLRDSVSEIVEHGSAAVDSLKAQVGDAVKSVKDGGASAIDRTTSFIEQNPYKSLAIAFGFGYLVMRVQTSPVIKVALVGGLAYLGTQLARR